MERLQNKVAIITGAAGGMGQEEAMLFAREGASVIATDINDTLLMRWVEAARADGLNIHYVKHDVCVEQDWHHVLDRAITLFGRIDILVNNAGIYPGNLTIEATSLLKWQQVLSVNLTGAFLGCKTVIPTMAKMGGGTIVNIASIAALVGGNGVAYSASKGGVVALSKDLAVTHAKDKIRVNSICPGGVKTPMTEATLHQPGMDDIIRNMSPQGRMALPIEIAFGALFLASDESSYMTGATLAIDGGAVAR